MDKKIANVYETSNYRKFKKMLDNREVSPQRIAKIVKSITQVGYIMSPIIVNEKMEVIDGQGRLAAAEQLNLPVYYVIAPGIGIEECRAMNLHQSNWTVRDFIKSYSVGGDINYINMQNLVNEYGNILGASTIYCLVCNVYGGGGTSEFIKSGQLQFPVNEYTKARKLCAYLSEFAQIVNHIGGRKESSYSALRFMFNVDGCDKNALRERVFKRQANLTSVANMEHAVLQFEDCYNYRCSNKIYFSAEYKKWSDERYKRQKQEQHQSCFDGSER